jgi:hypothetical protein
MGYMSEKEKSKDLSELEIDRLVVAHADDDSAWEKPVHVHRAKLASISIPAELAARAAFLAQLHRKTSVEEWLTHIIQERVALEEAMYSGVKQDLAIKGK